MARRPDPRAYSSQVETGAPAAPPAPSGRVGKRAPRARRPRVVVVGDGVVPTGFSRVVHSILARLTARYDFHHLALNYDGQEHSFAWKIHPLGDGGDYFGIDRVKAMVTKLRPELVFLVNDIWVIARYMDALGELRDRIKFVAYSPVDGGPLEPSLLAAIRDLHVLVLYTRFARREVENALAPLRREQPDLAFPEIEVIPHGVDSEVFFPFARAEPGQPPGAGRRAAREWLFRDQRFEDAFIVLNANRNQPRKRIDITIKGFALFAADKPESVKLYLHMGVEDCGWNIVLLAKRHGIEDRLILTADTPYLPVVTDEVLNCIYNACDVGINTSVGEGWGLVSFEHAAAGAAQVVPRHSACEELWAGSAELLEPCVALTTERSLTEGLFVAPEEVARALERLYLDRGLLDETARKCLATATREDYLWSTIAGQWDRLFAPLAKAKPASSDLVVRAGSPE